MGDKSLWILKAAVKEACYIVGTPVLQPSNYHSIQTMESKMKNCQPSWECVHVFLVGERR